MVGWFASVAVSPPAANDHGICAASLPIGTLSCGRFATRRSKLFCLLLSSGCPRISGRQSGRRTAHTLPPAHPSVLRATFCRRFPCSIDCDRPLIVAASVSVCVVRRRRATRHRSWLRPPPPRVASRSRTKSGFSRIRRISSMAQIISDVKDVTNATCLMRLKRPAFCKSA